MDIRRDGHANQYASLLLSDKGRVVWCDEQTGVVISNFFRAAVQYVD